MKFLLLPLIFLLGIGIFLINRGLAINSNESILENVDAVQAMGIANRWKWSKEKIKSHVTSRQVIFEFPNGNIKKILLPKDKMLVAVAPYINETHQ
jgi:hypothetical protein